MISDKKYLLCRYFIRIAQLVRPCSMHTKHSEITGPQVLSDDLNQDLMRSMISVFRASRIFVGKYVAGVHISKAIKMF